MKRTNLFFEEIIDQNKPVLFVYHCDNTPDLDTGMKLISKKYNIKFQLSDCSVLDKKNWNYKPANYNNETISMMSSTGKGFCYIKNTNQFFIYKKNNIVIMHDLAISYSNKGIDTFGLDEMFTTLFKTNEETVIINQVEWLKNINILDDDIITEKLEDNNRKIDDLLAEKEELLNKLKQNESYKTILYSSGNILVETVKNILEEMLDISIEDKDEKKQDLFFKINKTNVLVEVKGVNHGFQRDNISQVSRHIKDFAEKHEIYGAEVCKKCKGVLILNPYDKHDLSEKISKEFYSREVIADAEFDKISTLDTLTLLNYYSKWKKDKNTVDLKHILLENNYNEPDFKEIIRI